MIKNVLYLGPRGSYSEIAALKFINKYAKSASMTEKHSIQGIIDSLPSEDADEIAAVLPLENSLEGIVRETQDNLCKSALKNYGIFAETQLKIEHSLIGYGQKSDIRIITSHSQAIAQCRKYIYNNFGDNVELRPALSTSGAVRGVSCDDKSVAAIGNSYCAELYNLPIIEKCINDKTNNTTRFIFISKTIPENINDNKVSIVFSTENIPGALNKVLNIFEKYNLNLSNLNSRPSGVQLGEYIFYADFGGHTEDEGVKAALNEIKHLVKMLEILSCGAIVF